MLITSRRHRGCNESCTAPCYQASSPPHFGHSNPDPPLRGRQWHPIPHLHFGASGGLLLSLQKEASRLGVGAGGQGRRGREWRAGSREQGDRGKERTGREQGAGGQEGTGRDEGSRIKTQEQMMQEGEGDREGNETSNKGRYKEILQHCTVYGCSDCLDKWANLSESECRVDP